MSEELLFRLVLAGQGCHHGWQNRVVCWLQAKRQTNRVFGFVRPFVDRSTDSRLWSRAGCSLSARFASLWNDMMLIADDKEIAQTRRIIFSTLRLANRYITCDYSVFVRHIYVAGLRREPEDEISLTTPLEENDIYHSRFKHLYLILSSEENRLAGYDAIVWAIPDLLGSCNRDLVADMIRCAFPTMTDLAAGLETLVGHIRDNSRRQDMILASVVSQGGIRGIAGARS